GAGFYDDRVPIIVYSSCSNGTNVSFYDGTFKDCGDVGDSVTFEFYGSEFAVWALRTTSGGNKNVCVDGDCTVISNHNGTLVFGEWFRISGLEIDVHTVSITNQAGTFQFDAVYVAPSDAVGTPPPSIHIIEVD